MLKDWCVTFIRPASVSSDIKLNLTKLWNTVKDFICCFIKLSQRPRKTLHCLNTYLRLSRIGLCSLAEIVFTYCSEYFTSMVWVFPEEVCPYAKIVPLYPHRTSMGKNRTTNETKAHTFQISDTYWRGWSSVPFTICLAQVLYTCSWVVLVGNTRSNE